MDTRASYGMTVTVQDQESKEETKFFLVTAPDENWQEAKISMYHPIGKALFSKVAGDVIAVDLEAGKRKEYKILEIEPT